MSWHGVAGLRVSLPAVVLAAAIASLSYPAHAACGDPPKAGVDWRGCDLRGANLRGVNLFRADLTGADLSGADLTNARMEHAILTGANIEGTKFNAAELGGTFWPTGFVCARGSVGRCYLDSPFSRRR